MVIIMAYEFINVIGSLPPINPHSKSGVTMVKFEKWGRSKTLLFEHDPRVTLTNTKGEQTFPSELWEELTKAVIDTDRLSKESLLLHFMGDIAHYVQLYGNELERLSWVIANLVR